MATMKVITRAGEPRTVPAKAGLSLMQLIRSAEIDELQAVCGGCCSCGTCHVYVFPCAHLRLPPVGRDEEDLLECLSNRQSESRLSCQILFDETFDGLTVRIAPEEADL